jgi:magnesium chelatase subunit D
VGDRPHTGGGDVAVLATLRAAAPSQRARGRAGTGLLLARGDLREPIREGREGNLVLFVVDASGSMAARQRMRAVKGCVMCLLVDAYQRRDRVGLVAFRGEGAETVLPLTSSVELAARRLEGLPTGGRTPLAAGLDHARFLLRAERVRDPRRRALVVLVTDGRANGGDGAHAGARRAAEALVRDGIGLVVVDSEEGPVRLGLARGLAQGAGAPVLGLDELGGEGLATSLRLMARRAA